MEEDYELIPLNPIRRLEKRLERLESSKDKEIFNDLLEMIKIGQNSIDEMVKLNADMMKEMVDLTSSVGSLVHKLDDFTQRIEVESMRTDSGELEKIEGANRRLEEHEHDLNDKMVKLEKRVNALVLSNMVMRGYKRKLVPRAGYQTGQQSQYQPAQQQYPQSQ